ncbi:hypothetical protein QBC45DRAFT_196207 [Copromyces sp. CBS 386.78]|nr:hypothetical protein QBC45DRAFT_196207 [Copromyces sp. CBS 386.78]
MCLEVVNSRERDRRRLSVLLKDRTWVPNMWDHRRSDHLDHSFRALLMEEMAGMGEAKRQHQPMALPISSMSPSVQVPYGCPLRKASPLRFNLFRLLRLVYNPSRLPLTPGLLGQFLLLLFSASLQVLTPLLLPFRCAPFHVLYILIHLLFPLSLSLYNLFRFLIRLFYLLLPHVVLSSLLFPLISLPVPRPQPQISTTIAHLGNRLFFSPMLFIHGGGWNPSRVHFGRKTLVESLALRVGGWAEAGGADGAGDAVAHVGCGFVGVGGRFMGLWLLMVVMVCLD